MLTKSPLQFSIMHGLMINEEFIQTYVHMYDLPDERIIKGTDSTGLQV